LIPFLGAMRDLKLTVASLDAAAVAQCCIDCETSVISGSIDSDGTTIVGSKALQYLRQTMLGVYVFEANAVTFQRGGSQGPCFSFSNHDRAHFFATAFQHAMHSIALVRTTGFARDGGYITPTPVKIADLIFPAMPGEDFADRLRDNGYESRVFPDHVAVIFSRSPAKTE
jgi:DeoR/GlpR family transcriptional regulator of sugar metabolism